MTELQVVCLAAAGLGTYFTTAAVFDHRLQSIDEVVVAGLGLVVGVLAMMRFYATL